jgi:hypothetical protein
LAVGSGRAFEEEGEEAAGDFTALPEFEMAEEEETSQLVLLLALLGECVTAALLVLLLTSLLVLFALLEIFC